MNNSWERVPNLKDAFSLMEMMVVLLIVAILAAATAPMVTKKMARNAGSGDSPWVFTGLSNSIAYNMNGNDNSQIIVGASSTPASLAFPTRLFIDSGNNASHIAFGNGNATPLLLTADPNNGRIGFSNAQIPNRSVAFGTGQTLDNESPGVVAIGYGANASGRQHADGYNGNIAIGYKAKAIGESSIGIGYNAESVTMNSAIAIGSNAKVSYSDKSIKGIAIGDNAFIQANPTKQKYFKGLSSAIAIGTATCAETYADIAIGSYSRAKNSAIAIGNGVDATHVNSVAIGNRAETTADNQIVLGNSKSTVYIPGNLIVGTNAYIGSSYGSFEGPHFKLFLKRNDTKWTQLSEPNGSDNKVKADQVNIELPWSSDRRLKNVGEKYTAGLDELKKLELFHYTFKKDEAKTPHVGVMAQDLQKVFPNAVTEGEDGYLQIRWEDMFYAVINAVKELDTKICEIVENLTSLSKKVDEQQQLIETQQTLIEELQKQNVDLEKRLMKLEKKKGTDLPK